MALSTDSADGLTLRQAFPLATFPISAFEELCTNIVVEQVADGIIFQKGDDKTEMVYLLSGSVTLQANGLVVEVISSKSESARFPLAHQIPRRIDAVANGLVRIVRLNADVVNNPPKVDYKENQGVTVSEEYEDSDDWMTSLLNLPLMQKLPPTSLQRILTTLKSAQFPAGHVIIESGALVDQYHLITQGHCLLQVDGDEYKLSEGDGFGESYILSGLPVKERVVTLSNVHLITLDGKLFIKLIKEPLLKYVQKDQLPDMQANGAILLDVRDKEAYDKKHMTGSVNMPLLSLRKQVDGLTRDKSIVVLCNSGNLSEAGAFLLQQSDLNVFVLKDGLGYSETEPEAELAEAIQPEIVEADQKPAEEGALIEPELGEADSLDDGATQRDALSGADLAIINQELTEKVEKLETENSQLKQRCQQLTMQLNKMKLTLNRLKH
jgi:rhodanese-related sulfurtransferase/quercetin dioxygenase-like cupin family protein